MRVALLVFADFPNGNAPARRVHMLAKGLVAAGCRVDVIIPQRFDSGPLRAEMDGFTVRWGMQTDATGWKRLSSRAHARREALRSVHELAKEGLDWLLLSNPTLDGLFLFTVARSQGVAVIAMYDDLRAKPQRWLGAGGVFYVWRQLGDLLLPRLAQFNVAISDFLARRLRSAAPRTPVSILPPLVDLELFRREKDSAVEYRRRWDLGEDVVIAYLGSYWTVDGVAVLLAAAKVLHERGRRFRVVISGAAVHGLPCDDVPMLIRQYGLSEVVVQTGWLQLNEVAEAMGAADVLVVPKIWDIANIAGVPTKLAEYLASGRAVVASRIGDIPRYVTHGVDGFLCTPGDAGELADTLEKLILDPDLRESVSQNARAAARTHFDCRTAAVRLVEELRARS